MRNGIKETPQTEDLIDNTIEDSFPASDPPSWTAGTRHSPAHQPQEQSNLRRFVRPTLYALAGVGVVLSVLWWLQKDD
jgi:hypothetical protein